MTKSLIKLMLLLVLNFKINEFWKFHLFCFFWYSTEQAQTPDCSSSNQETFPNTDMNESFPISRITLFSMSFFTEERLFKISWPPVTSLWMVMLPTCTELWNAIRCPVLKSSISAWPKAQQWYSLGASAGRPNKQ